jgi:hypothetical protein
MITLGPYCSQKSRADVGILTGDRSIKPTVSGQNIMTKISQRKPCPAAVDRRRSMRRGRPTKARPIGVKKPDQKPGFQELQ